MSVIDSVHPTLLFKKIVLHVIVHKKYKNNITYFALLLTSLFVLLNHIKIYNLTILKPFLKDQAF